MDLESIIKSMPEKKHELLRGTQSSRGRGGI
jgi:hypothetical protein